MKKQPPNERQMIPRRVVAVALPLLLSCSWLLAITSVQPAAAQPAPGSGANKPAAQEPPGKTPPAAAAPPAGAPEPNKVSEFMRAKLLHSQKLLEGLTTENFDVIAKQSQELSLLSQAATWQVLQTQEYRDRSTEFRRAAEAVTEAARKKNLDAAALAYVDVTMKCVSCHKYVRHVRMARGLRPHETRVVRLDD